MFAFKAVALVCPEVKGKLTGIAFRVLPHAVRPGPKRFR